ncbi:MAG: HAD family hydrolase [Bacillota bacterium]
MYKAIIFDLGNVLISISYPRILEYWSQISGKQFTDIPKYKKIIDEEELLLEVGRITPAEFRKRVAFKTGMQIADSEFDKGWNRIFVGLNPGIEEVLTRLRPLYRLVCLTNTNFIHTLEWQKEYSQITGYFEKIFCSHEIGCRKPEPEAFQTVLDYLKLSPAEVIFIDDNEANIAGAAKMGITAVLMKSVSQLFNDLKELGIQVA